MVNITRYINSVRLISSWLYSRIKRSPVVWGMPFSAGIELTNRCNLRCPECLSGSGLMNRGTGFMSAGLFDLLVEQLGSYMINTMFYFQGESMLHPRFFEFLEKARRMGVIISTNGHFIDRESAGRLADSGARKIIVSLDGITDDTYSAYRRGGDVARVMEGILLLGEKCAKRRGAPELVIQVLVNSYNESEIDDIKRFAKGAKARVTLKSMQLLSPAEGHYLLPSEPGFRRYESSGNSIKWRRGVTNHCFRLWTNPVITWDGRVVPCCFDKDADYEMGNLNDAAFKEIWYGEKYNRFREKLLTDRSSIAMCLNCTSGISGRVPV